MKLNHTGHEVYKCARVAGHTKSLFFNGLVAVTGPLYFICANVFLIFLVCNILSLNLYVI